MWKKSIWLTNTNGWQNSTLVVIKICDVIQAVVLRWSQKTNSHVTRVIFWHTFEGCNVEGHSPNSLLKAIYLSWWPGTDLCSLPDNLPTLSYYIHSFLSHNKSDKYHCLWTLSETDLPIMVGLTNASSDLTSIITLIFLPNLSQRLLLSPIFPYVWGLWSQ